MPFKKCLRCKGVGRSTVVVSKFSSRDCGHIYCHSCGITHDTDIDDISSQDMSSDDISDIADESAYRKIFVETSRVRNESGEDYGKFKWADQKELRAGVAAPVVESIRKYFDDNEDIEILDLGCGSGFTSAEFVDELIHATVTSIDPSPQVIGVHGYKDRVLAYQGTIQSLSPKLGKFHVVVIVGNLMLHDDPIETVKQAASHLHDDGLLILDFKNIKSSSRQIGILLARVGLSRFFPERLFSRNYVNMRYGFHEAYLVEAVKDFNLELISTLAKAPRLLNFDNASEYTSGWKGRLWRVLDFVDKLRGQRAWTQLEFKKAN